MENATNYLEKIKALDEEYEEVVNNAETNFMLVGDRCPYAYLVEILAIDSIQSTTIQSGETYLEIMENNLEVLEKVLDNK